MVGCMYASEMKKPLKKLRKLIQEVNSVLYKPVLNYFCIIMNSICLGGYLIYFPDYQKEFIQLFRVHGNGGILHRFSLISCCYQ